jgi:hypothetical protein
MIDYLNRYFAVTLALSLTAPFWLVGLADSSLSLRDTFRDAGFVTTVMSGGLWLIKKRRGYQVRGTWRYPTKLEAIIYGAVLISVLLIDFGSKLLFFDKERMARVEVFRDFGLQSYFHETSFEPFHLYILLYFLFLFLVGALHFRFTVKTLDCFWLISAAAALGGGLALVSERLVFGGVHDTFYLSGSLRWLCPPCGAAHPGGFIWTPADFFVHAAAIPILIFFLSYFVPTPLKNQPSARTNPTRLQSSNL